MTILDIAGKFWIFWPIYKKPWCQISQAWAPLKGQSYLCILYSLLLFKIQKSLSIIETETYVQYIIHKSGEVCSVDALYISLKEQCYEIIDLGFFSWISFPQTPKYPIRAVLNFFKNSRKYSQLKVHHAPVSLTVMANGKNLQTEKLYIFCLDTLDSRVNI